MFYTFDCEFFNGSLNDRPVPQAYGFWSVQAVKGIGATSGNVNYNDKCQTYSEWGVSASSAMDVPLRFARVVSMIGFLLSIPILIINILPTCFRFEGERAKTFFYVIVGCDFFMGVISLLCLVSSLSFLQLLVLITVSSSLIPFISSYLVNRSPWRPECAENP